MDRSDRFGSVDSAVSSKDLAMIFGIVKNPLSPEKHAHLRQSLIGNDDDYDSADENTCLKEDPVDVMPNKTLSERISYYFSCFKSKVS